jgi:hypothetical protein
MTLPPEVLQAMDKVVITKPVIGIFHMQVCACNTATDEEILAACNAKNPSGTSAGWTQVIRETDDEKFGHENNKAPVQCADDPTRTHYMIVC